MSSVRRLPLLYQPILPEQKPSGPRPVFRAECLPGGDNEERPCPWHECRYHLNHAKATCLLDLYDRGGMSLEEISEIIGLTRERIRQIEEAALHKLKKKGITLQMRN